MVSYTNETKIIDLPEIDIKKEVKILLKNAVMDFNIEMTKDTFEHTYNRLGYLISIKYKQLMLGEVKYIFECMVEYIKGKLSVSSILYLFAKYIEIKIEKHRQQMQDSQINYDNNINNCLKFPLGSAIIHKINMVKSGDLSIDDWERVNLKTLASQIESGQVKVMYPIKNKKNKLIVNN
jgi:hypothetical protein